MQEQMDHLAAHMAANQHGVYQLPITPKMNMNLIWHTRHDPHHLDNQIRRFKADGLEIPTPAIAPSIGDNVTPAEDKILAPLGAEPHMTEGVQRIDGLHPSGSNIDPHNGEG